ncbi:peptidoglycan-binding protein [Nocardiopsis ansamitocini]|uniref:Peptidoglycan-binding protein n=1 Tax=Nocardiopsis ansamitocini TaxID=1670832 RepID=A0A9W6P7T0_9ACTN|nr:peptidoglycan-binding protein [Nocardiopsis ansamitocini]
MLAVSTVMVAGFGTVAHAGTAPTGSLLAAGAPAAAGLNLNAADVQSGLLRQGAKGSQVKAIQQRLIDLGYWLDGADGEFGPLTTQAVYAVQKAAGIERDGVVGPATRAALDKGVRPKASTSSGNVVEIDLARQLLLVVSDGKVRRIFNTSTGSGKPYVSNGQKQVATTPKGRYPVFRAVDAWDPGPLGALYRPKYFNRGIAVHGYSSVPPYPASHGCARVSIAAMDWLWANGSLKQHTPVVVR